ncbi:hypothetical protein LTR66_001251, partial [Elasticomyces elasticus]
LASKLAAAQGGAPPAGGYGGGGGGGGYPAQGQQQKAGAYVSLSFLPRRAGVRYIIGGLESRSADFVSPDNPSIKLIL